jgi:hypothetical protein
VTNHLRWSSLITIVTILLAACGGSEDSISTSTPHVVQSEISDAEGRPTIDAGVLTEIAGRTPTVGPTQTIAVNAKEPLAISTTVSQPCTEQGDADTGLMNFEQYFENVECIEPYFPWPMDRRIDWAKYQAMFAGQEGGFGPGFEYVGMTSFHVCAWFETWLDAYAAGNDGRASAALDIMLNFIPNYETVVPGFPDDVFMGNDKPYLSFGQAAALGDPTPIQSYVDGNFGWLPEWRAGS